MLIASDSNSLWRESATNHHASGPTIMYAKPTPRTRFVGSGKRVLLVAPDRDCRTTLVACLESSDFDVRCVASGTDAVAHMADDSIPDLIMLDFHHPEIDDFWLARILNLKGDIPVIVVSDITDMNTVVWAIREFADDYIRRPFNEAELLARVHRVLLRVALPYDGPYMSRQRIADGLYVELGTGSVYMNGARTVLTPIENQILRVLLRSRGDVVPYQSLMSAIWQTDGHREHLNNSLWVHIRRLRTKIEPDPQKPRHLLTERGNGYRLVL